MASMPVARRQREHLAAAIALVACVACGGKQAEAPAPAATVSIGDAGAPVAVADASTGPQPVSATTSNDADANVTIATGGQATVLGLEIAVTENTEKRTETGGFMRVRLRVRANGEEGTIALSGEAPGHREATWKAWKLEYRGGWRHDVQLRVTKER
jgi:hypothetical protein